MLISQAYKCWSVTYIRLLHNCSFKWVERTDLFTKYSHNHRIKQVTSTDIFTIFSDIYSFKQVNSTDLFTKISENHKLNTSIQLTAPTKKQYHNEQYIIMKKIYQNRGDNWEERRWDNKVTPLHITAICSLLFILQSVSCESEICYGSALHFVKHLLPPCENHTSLNQARNQLAWHLSFIILNVRQKE